MEIATVRRATVLSDVFERSSESRNHKSKSHKSITQCACDALLEAEQELLAHCHNIPNLNTTVCVRC